MTGLPSSRPHLTEVQRMLADSVSAFAKRSAPGELVRAWRGRAPGYDVERWREMAALGWTGLLVDERHGGAGLGLDEMAVVAEGLAAHLAPEPVVPCAVLAATLLQNADDGEMAARLLQTLASGEATPAPAFQEAPGELLPEPPLTRLERTAAGLTVSGAKRFVMGAGAAQGFVVSAATADGVVLVWVPSQTEGLSVESRELADGRLAHELQLRDARLPASSLLAGENTAPGALIEATHAATLMVCAELIGVLGAALDMTLEYLRTRVQFGQPIGSFQSLQHRSVDLYVQQELARASLAEALKTAREAPGSNDASAAISRAKARCNDAAALVTRQAVQMHGAIGFTEDSDVGLYLKRALALGAWLGNSTFHRREFMRHAASEQM